MTLTRQLMVLVTALFVLVFSGTFVISVKDTRNYLRTQLASHAQDAATSLGLSITPVIEDEVLVSSMVDAMFDSGDYRELHIYRINGDVMMERQLDVVLDDVPPWFIKAFPLETPAGEALVNSGWQQAGSIMIRSHPGYAYQKLWSSTIETFWWFLLTGIGTMLAAYGGVRLLLKPLHAMEQQANDICQRRFTIVEWMPRTRELRQIVEAMNRMSRRVNRMFTEQEEVAASLREELYKDAVTGLGNRRYFSARLQALLESKEECASGILAIVQLNHFKEYNIRNGYQAGDALLAQTARNLETALSQWHDPVLAHLSGADFAVMLPDVGLETGAELGAALSQALQDLSASEHADDEDVGHVGMVFYNGEQDIKGLFSQADMALQSARGSGANGWHFADQGGQTSVRAAQDWKVFIERVIAEERIGLDLQPVYSMDRQTILHEEAYARVFDEDGERMSAGLIFPSAEALGLAPALDRAVLNQALQLLEGSEIPKNLAINLSPSALSDGELGAWLSERLQGREALGERLLLEFTEYGARSRLEELKAFMHSLEGSGVRISLDHFGRGFSGFGYLQSLPLHSLKIDGSFIRDIHQNSDNRFYLRALTEIAHGQEIAVIAESVESQDEWQALNALHLDGGQGYFLARPRQVV